MYKIYIRDQNLNRVGEIDDYNYLDIIPRFNGVGSFALELPTDCKETKQLLNQRAGIIVKRDGKTLFSGDITSRNRKWNKDQDKMTFGGVDDNRKLLNLAYPVPSGNFSLQDYDIRMGAAETVMKEYIEANLGVNALAERRVQNLIIAADQGLGNVVTGRARFHPLIEMFSSLAISGGDLGFRIVQIGSNLEFQVYQPTDLTKQAFFSPLLGNLLEFEYSNKDPETNFAIVGGGGEGKDRILLQKSDNASITKYGRIETFIDQRNTSEISELQQSMDEELASKGEQNSLSITPIDTDSLSFGRDYNLGDKVSIILTIPNEVVEILEVNYFISMFQASLYEERVRKIQNKLDIIQDVVREIKIRITPEGVRISPTIGTPDSISRNSIGIFDKMKKIIRRVSNLERR
ncbi:siphovirus ReqiPepy6 Gp37-like family protein [Bacillus sp. 03113]|uniref:siphovirus ReqiPepy6 Gp37-like family protein n=1 Tax=Bacillus sp. 03113 TaxID=2578211 RepID=UPI001144BEE5|nr:siphovirus ReqiPepy6 Gp37-like family protein [Bacillus sp. 03113]